MSKYLNALMALLPDKMPYHKTPLSRRFWYRPYMFDGIIEDAWQRKYGVSFFEWKENENAGRTDSPDCK
jgi:hypothetical protein